MKFQVGQRVRLSTAYPTPYRQGDVVEVTEVFYVVTDKVYGDTVVAEEEIEEITSVPK